MFFKSVYVNHYQIHFRLEFRLSKLKITLKEQSAKIEQIQNHLLQEGLVSLVFSTILKILSPHLWDYIGIF
jgi:hypothetical protein